MITLRVVDAFTDRPFAGNPAAVAVVDAFPPDRSMQDVAAEINLSETAFVVARPDGDHDLRWFSPTVEVDLCGHATLAAAHVLGGAPRFHTRGGRLDCRPAADGEIEMAFPADPPAPCPEPPPIGNRAPIRWGAGRSTLLAELPDEDAVRSFEPDLAAIAGLDRVGVIVTAASASPGVDFVSRFFAPAVGIPEDPVTGSAHCTLAVWWAARLGRDGLTGYQASRRGGTVRMTLDGDTVTLGGQAVTVSEISLLVAP